LDIVDVESFSIDDDIENGVGSGKSDHTIGLRLVGNGLGETHPSRLHFSIVKGFERDYEVNHTIRTYVERDQFAIPDYRGKRRHRR
jgi:hypothetical protein